MTPTQHTVSHRYLGKAKKKLDGEFLSLNQFVIQKLTSTYFPFNSCIFSCMHYGLLYSTKQNKTKPSETERNQDNLTIKSSKVDWNCKFIISYRADGYKLLIMITLVVKNQ